MIRVPLLTADGTPLTIEISTSPPHMRRHNPGSAFYLRQSGDVTPLPEGPTAELRNKTRASYPASMLVDDATIERLVDRIGGWQNVFHCGEPMECSRSILRLVLRTNHYREQIERAIRDAQLLGVLHG